MAVCDNRSSTHAPPHTPRGARLAVPWVFLFLAVGCVPSGPSQGRLEAVWGERGVSQGRFQIPRAIALDHEDQLYIVDKTGRIQVFTSAGEFLRSWQTPLVAAGKPSGLSFDLAGNLLVADTHYYRMLVYTPQGELLPHRTLGGVNGQQPGQFEFVTHAVVDSLGNYYISEYGEFDRVQKFTPQGKFLFQWGGHGSQLGEFIRPQKLAVDEHNHIWVADACNHRIQVFDATGSEAKLIRHWGQPGPEPGQLSYPYDLRLDGQGHLYVCEYGNHRVQKFTLEGQSLGCWGANGRGPGELHNPWGAGLDQFGRLHVLDTYNHRVQRVRL